MPSKSIPWSRLGAEFVVIFVGVTLLLLADDWRQDRESRAAELPDAATSSWVPEGLVFTTSWDAFRRDSRVEATVALLGLSAGSWVEVAGTAVEANRRLLAAIRRVAS